MNPAPIGIFDSGLGGLTVAHAIAKRLPGDRDGDGVPDSKDKCPDEPGVNDNILRGCPELPLAPLTPQKP